MNINRRIKLILIVILSFYLQTNTIIADIGKKILTLDEAIEKALQNNPELEISRADVDISQSQIKAAKSSYYPQIKTKIVLPLVGRESGFFLDQLIYDFGRTPSLVRSKKFEHKASKFNYEQNLIETIQNTKIIYYKVLIAKNNLIFSQKNLIKNELLLIRTKELNKIGKSSNLELTNANSEFGSARLELTNSENQVETTKLDLINIIGVDNESDFELEENTKIETKEYKLEDLVEKALEKSLVLKNLEANQAAIRASVSASKKEFYPIIFSRVAYRFEGEGADDEGDDTPSFIAGAGIKFPIFLGFSRFAKVDESNALLRRSQAEIAREKQRISSDAKKMFLDLKFSKEKIGITETNKQLSEKNLKLVKEKLTLGRASKIDLADAEALYSSSNAKYLEAVYNYKIVVTRIKKITGEL